MKRKFFTLLCAILASTSVILAESVQIGNLYYNLNAADRTATVARNSANTSLSGVLNIPSTVNSGGQTYTVTSIEQLAFSGSNITKITIPVNVSYVGSLALACPYLEEVVWNAKNCTFDITGVFGGSLPELHTVTFGSTVDSIPANFLGSESQVNGLGSSCSTCGLLMPQLHQIVIPDNVKGIGAYAFGACGYITDLTVGKGVTSIGKGAFSGMYYGLKRINWNAISCTTNGKPFEAVGSYASDYDIEMITIGNQVKDIPANLFPVSTQTTLTIPASVKTIGNKAFEWATRVETLYWNAVNCSDFTDQVFAHAACTSVVIGSQVQHIPAYMCIYMTKLKNITIPNNVTSIGEAAFYQSGLTNITLPNSITVIEDNTFSTCVDLQSVSFNNVSIIGKNAFYSCGLKDSITIPDCVTVIKQNAFNANNGIHAVLMSRNLSRLGVGAFYCDKLYKVYMQSSTPPVLEGAAFNSMISEYVNNTPSVTPLKIYVPCGSLEAYQGANNWSLYYSTNFIEGNSGNCGQSQTTYYTVTFKDWNGAVLKLEQVEAGQSATPPTNPTRTGYTFIGWDKDYSNVTSDLTVTALYQQNGSQPTYYTVTFKDWDGAVLKLEQVEAGQSATPPTNPTRTGYTFIGWDKDYSNVTSDLTVTALYQKNSTQPTYYTVTFKDWDGTVLKIEQVEAGHAATPPTPPTRQGYAFVGWNREFDAVYYNMTITAQYERDGSYIDGINVRLQPVQASSWNTVYLWAWTSDGNVFSNWPGQIVTKDENGWFSYTFDEYITSVNIIWSDLLGNQTIDITNVTESTCYSLKSTSGNKIGVNVVTCPGEILQSYTVTFLDWNGAVLKVEDVLEGQSATAPSNPTRDGYTFIGWDEDFSNVTSNLTITALYRLSSTSDNAITVRLDPQSCANWSTVYLWAWTSNGNVFSVSWPGMVINTDNEGWYAYTFDENISNVSIIWNNGKGSQTVDITDVTQSTCFALNSTSGSAITVRTIDDCFTPDVTYYTVVFLDWNGDVLKEEEVAEGESATAPSDPTREGYTFIGWDGDFYNVTEDLIITALYTYNEGFVNIDADGCAPTKFLDKGQLFIIRGDRVYTLTGQEVK